MMNMDKFAVLLLLMTSLLIATSLSVGATADLERISVDFFNVDCRSAFQDLAYRTGVTILVDDYVDGFVTLTLTDVSLDRVMEIMCMKGGYGFKKIDDSLYVVGSIDPGNPTFQKHAVTEIVELDYARAGDIIDLLPHHRRYLSGSGGRIVVRAWPNQLSSIVGDIRELDIPIKQVLGRVVIAEVTEEAKRELGIKLGESAALSYADSVRLSSLLRVLEIQGKAVLKASTSVVVPEGEQSTISIGKEISKPIREEQAADHYRIERMETTTYLTLGVERVTSRNEIRMTYEVASEDFGSEIKSEMPSILSRRAKGTVTVGNNCAFTIGGLSREIVNTVSGAFPPTKSQTQTNTELLILILPNIVGTPIPQELLEGEVNDFLSEAAEKIADSRYKAIEDDRMRITAGIIQSDTFEDIVNDQDLEPFGFITNLEGELRLTPNIGAYAGVMASTSSTLHLTYGGLVLRTGDAESATLYLGAGVQSGSVKIGSSDHRTTGFTGKAGLDLRVGDSFVVGIGYTYSPMHFESKQYDIHGPFARFGLTF